MRDLFTRPIMWLLAALFVLLAVTVLSHQLASGKRAKVEARLGRNQVDAATQSGSDAVNVVAEQQAAETAADDLSRRNADEISNAKGADARVDPAAARAGRASLCRRAAYSQRAECLQLAAPH